MVKRIISRGWGLVTTVAGTGMVFASSCSSTEVKQALLAGAQVAADQLLTTAPDDDVSFGDWLSSELDN